jgi:hypothetical protein
VPVSSSDRSSLWSCAHALIDYKTRFPTGFCFWLHLFPHADLSGSQYESRTPIAVFGTVIVPDSPRGRTIGSVTGAESRLQRRGAENPQLPITVVVPSHIMEDAACSRKLWCGCCDVAVYHRLELIGCDWTAARALPVLQDRLLLADRGQVLFAAMMQPCVHAAMSVSWTLLGDLGEGRKEKGHLRAHLVAPQGLAGSPLLCALSQQGSFRRLDARHTCPHPCADRHGLKLNAQETARAERGIEQLLLRVEETFQAPFGSLSKGEEQPWASYQRASTRDTTSGRQSESVYSHPRLQGGT